MFTSKKQLAVRTLRGQIEKLRLKDFNYWHSQTHSFFIDFFGKDSKEYETLNQVHFRRRPYHDHELEARTTKATKEKENQEAVDSMIRFMERCIETLHVKGVHKEPNTNWWTRLSERWKIAILSATIPAVISSSYFIGVANGSVNEQELREGLDGIHAAIQQVQKEQTALTLRVDSALAAPQRIPQQEASEPDSVDQK